MKLQGEEHHLSQNHDSQKNLPPIDLKAYQEKLPQTARNTIKNLVTYEDLPISATISKWSLRYNSELDSELTALGKHVDTKSADRQSLLVERELPQKLQQSNRMVKELQFSLSRVVALPEEKYTVLHLNRYATVDVIAETSRLCQLDTKGCFSPLQIRIWTVEDQGFPPNADIQIFMSLTNKEPSFSNCQKSAINIKSFKFAAPRNANAFKASDIVYFCFQSTLGC